MKKILVAMSGGVDSSVAALLLKKEGYQVAGAYIKTWVNEEGDEDIFAHCPWEEDINDCQAVAKQLGITFEVVNLIRDYKKRVVEYLVEGYRKGLTPNPDIMCNREMKFGVFLDYALANGFDGVATGHYCRKIKHQNGKFDILEGVDKNKDQSYFLALVAQAQIQKALFPLGNLHKQDVRAIAKKYHLPVATKKDSQGICFLGKISINKFLEKFISPQPGDIVNAEGKLVGKHKGLHRYTLGQRKGIGVPSNTDFKNYVVIGKDYSKNELKIAFEEPNTPGLFERFFRLRNMSFINQKLTAQCSILGKPRYRDPSEKLFYIPEKNNTATIQFAAPQRALAKGQVLALYDNEVLLGGGIYF